MGSRTHMYVRELTIIANSEICETDVSDVNMNEHFHTYPGKRATEGLTDVI